MLLHFKVHHTHAEQPGGCSPTWHFLAIYVHHSQTMAVNLGRAGRQGLITQFKILSTPFGGSARCTAVWQAATTATRPAYLRRRSVPMLGLRHIVGPNIKNPPNIRMKISWNWRIILMPATIWQVLKVKRTQRPETEVRLICWNFYGKTREITLEELIFGGF